VTPCDTRFASQESAWFISTVAVFTTSSCPWEALVTIAPESRIQHHPVVTAHKASRAADIQLRTADAVTSFAGSMRFVYLHAVGFAIWMLFVEKNPWPKLTLIVSLEAIFLSTFVMIGQNRQASFQQAKADHDFVEQELELKTNTELTRAIHAMTKEIQQHVLPTGDGRGRGRE